MSEDSLPYFAPFTTVSMADGTQKPISQLKIGDKVITDNIDKTFATVLNITIKQIISPTLFTPFIYSRTLAVTENTSIYDILSNEWKLAKDIWEVSYFGKKMSRIYSLTLDAKHTIITRNCYPCHTNIRSIDGEPEVIFSQSVSEK